MKLTKSKLKQIIKEELANTPEKTKNLEEGAYTGDEDPRTEWLVDRVGELFKRITRLENQIAPGQPGEYE